MNHEKLKYIPNRLGSTIIILTVVVSLVFQSFTLNEMDKTFEVGIYILENIGFMLFAFLYSIKIGNYKYNWAKASFLIGIIQISRILIIPSGIGEVLLYSTMAFYIISGLLYIYVGKMTLTKIKFRSEA